MLWFLNSDEYASRDGNKATYFIRAGILFRSNNYTHLINQIEAARHRAHYRGEINGSEKIKMLSEAIKFNHEKEITRHRDYFNDVASLISPASTTDNPYYYPLLICVRRGGESTFLETSMEDVAYFDCCATTHLLFAAQKIVFGVARPHEDAICPIFDEYAASQGFHREALKSLGTVFLNQYLKGHKQRDRARPFISDICFVPSRNDAIIQLADDYCALFKEWINGNILHLLGDEISLRFDGIFTSNWTKQTDPSQHPEL